MKYLKVNLWGMELGRLVWESSTRRIYFMYNPKLKNVPDVAPLLSPSKNRNILLPIYGDDRFPYQGLPPFIADSLPDSWGSILFDRWVKENKIPRNRVTPLYKLMFIGKRGMGALEYEPFAEELITTHSVNVKSLYDLSLKIVDERDSEIANINDKLTLQALLAVGTSAGGRQMKAIVAINEETGEIRSGQTDLLKGYDYYILKFGDKTIPIAEIEVAYYNMAIAAGVFMNECRLLQVDNINHFLTKRFDRVNGKKIHVQTLAAINPDACCYEDIVATCRELSLSEKEIEQLYRRMVFNVLSNTTDDHNKNFSFILEENGKWHLSPAYDMTFIFNMYATGPNIERKMSIGGKVVDITKQDLIDFAKQNDIKNASLFINQIAVAIKNFSAYAEDAGIVQPWRSIIQKTLNDNLIALGYLDRDESDSTPFVDKFGRCIEDIVVTINSKKYIEVSVTISGRRHKKFIRPNMDIYSSFIVLDLFNLNTEDKIRIAESLFPLD